jgi:hypothetical protein
VLRLALTALFALPGAVQAWDLAGDRALVLYARDGGRHPIGQVRFEPQPDGSARFQVKPDAAALKDYFLSMREFKCLDGASEVLCHVPYPYPQPGTVRPGELAWLEHALLFMFKKPSEFGAKLWNGVYWQLRATPQGLEGRPQAVDLNQISAPPATPGVPPFKPAMRDDMPEGARWFVRLTIE